MKLPLTTLCYIEENGCYLMMHRVSKKNDVNHGKWIGVGGHFEEGESPEDCLVREVREETSLVLNSWSFRGMITFISNAAPAEYMCLYTSADFSGTVGPCNEGVLEWVQKENIPGLNLWEGDRIFLELLLKDAPFFSLKLVYQNDHLVEKILNGKPL